MSSTAIPAVIDAYTALLNASSTLRGVQILDGPPLTDLASDFICVGWSPFDDLGASSVQAPAQLGRLVRQEDFELVCYADSYSGDVSTSDRRARVFALVDACSAIVDADPTINGSLTQYAELIHQELRQERTEAGLSIGVVFRFQCHTRVGGI